MKKTLLLAAMCCLLLACNNNEPKQTKLVTFHVDAFKVSTQPMKAPQRAPILDDADGVALTDLYIFDGTTLLAHQTSDMEAFGTVSLVMEYGAHTMSFVATRSDGQSYESGVLSVTGVKPTFGKVQSITIGDAADAFEVTMQRVSGQLVVTFTDEIPADAETLRIEIATKYDDMDVTTLNGANGYAYARDVAINGKAGKAGQSWTLNTLAAVYGEQYTTDVTLTVLRADASVIAQHLIEDVPLASNTKTLLTGEMFAGQTFGVSVDHTWAEDLQPEW